jgi:hypothetical protein
MTGDMPGLGDMWDACVEMTAAPMGPTWYMGLKPAMEMLGGKDKTGAPEVAGRVWKR